jgi:redox-sensing transcriptional repressor
MENDIPDIIVGRLPIYLQALEHLQAQGIQTTSSQELGEIIGISAAQIRKDLSQFGEFGKQGKGYAISFLVEQLREILNVNHLWDMVVIGAGNLGRAIANYQSFRNHGFQVSMIFDIDPARIGTVIEGYTIQDMSQLVSLVQRSGIKIAMLTVPSTAAQAVTNDLIKAGIKAILNYAPITLFVPTDVHVQYVDPVIYLQKMTYYLK